MRLSLSMHEVLNSVGSGEALVLELERVVEEARMLLELVRLATQELVDLHLVRGVERLALGLRAVMSVVLVVVQRFVRVRHVFAGVDVEVLALDIVDLRHVSL